VEYKYTDSEGTVHKRSEALAAASLDMFMEGMFSSDPSCIPHRVNSSGLRALTEHQFERGFQVSKTNQIVGSHPRFRLLQRLAGALEACPEFFGREVCRPGNIVDYMAKQSKEEKQKGKDGKETTRKTCSVRVLWRAVIEGFESIWPENLSGVRRGDVWNYSPLKRAGVVASDMIPFHKLSQWLTYSLLEPLERVGITVTDLHLLTGLAEYRNGGLFIDMGVLVPTSTVAEKMQLDVGAELVVEWRALTVALLDELAVKVRRILGKTEAEMPLARVLQGGTWQAGREKAGELRGGAPPISVRSDGTVF